ncbi:STAS-like domain-containing protein [Methylobacterium sp. C33D]
MREVQVSIARIVGSGICVSAPDGHKVHEVIYRHIAEGRRVFVSFSSVTRMTTAFLNAAIGQLYGEFSQETLRQHLAPPIDADKRQLTQLKLVVDRARAFFSDPERAKNSFRVVTGIEEEAEDEE